MYCFLKRILVLVILFVYCNVAEANLSDSFQYLDRVRPQASDSAQTEAARALIRRILPEEFVFFNVSVDSSYLEDGKDSFTLFNNGASIDIVGSSGVAAVWGFHYYIKYYCNCHIGWQVSQVRLPIVRPDVNIRITAKDRFRYHQNVCTTSYSFVWWGEAEWRKHLDWMALNGINLALASNGQEAIWVRVYQQLNLTDDEIKEHFAGPAFLSWQRMGNIGGWAGPLSADWHNRSLTLEHFIVDAMNELGITPVLPAFAGHVPKAFKRIFPDANMTEVEPWNDFSGDNCCPLYLQPDDPTFTVVGKLFLTEMINEFGASHVYNSDPFNENKPASDEPAFLNNVGAAIYQSMASVDPDAIWLLQGWMFIESYWTPPKVQSLLTSVALGKILVLDLQSEQWPQYDRLEQYFGQPFIWCMLHNFGGTLGMFGDSQSINTDVYSARNNPNSTMVGIGLTPEGINQNYILYDLMLESALNDEPQDLDDWVRNYTIRRYGARDENAMQAWSILMGSVYNYTGLDKMRGKYIVTRRPNLDIKTWTWYSSADLFGAWKLFLDASENITSSYGYKHDLTDLTRQVCQYRGDQMYSLIMQAFEDKNITELLKRSNLFLDVFMDLQEILSTSEDFLIGKWIEAARAIASDEDEYKQFEYNARNQITLWGPNGEIIDYANKQWAGIIVDYYQPRWSSFLNAMYDSVLNDYKFNKTAVLDAIFTNVEEAFTFSSKAYPIYEIGMTVDIAHKIYRKFNLSEVLPDVPIDFIPKGRKRTEASYKRLLSRVQRSPREEEENEYNELDFEEDNDIQYSVVLSP